jgi:hypothetical protein
LFGETFGCRKVTFREFFLNKGFFDGVAGKILLGIGNTVQFGSPVMLLCLPPNHSVIET